MLLDILSGLDSRLASGILRESTKALPKEAKDFLEVLTRNNLDEKQTRRELKLSKSEWRYYYYMIEDSLKAYCSIHKQELEDMEFIEGFMYHKTGLQAYRDYGSSVERVVVKMENLAEKRY